jgi:serine phosphatase RsbU (regulator of sigma subunit)
MSVLNQLNTLEKAGLIRVAQVTPDLEYLFQHTLVQDAAYASLLEEDQSRLHLEVGEVLEELFAGSLDDIAATLADHFEKAGKFERAFRYYIVAAKKSLAAYANQEAEGHFRCAIPLAPDPASQADALHGLGEALFQQSHYEEAIHAWQEAIEKYRQLEDNDKTARLYARSARAAWFFEIPKGLQFCQEGLAVVEGASESPGLALLVHEAARAHFFNGFPERASQLCRQALEMAERLDDFEVRADALSTLGILQDTPEEEALSALRQAVDLAEVHGFISIATRASLNLGTMTKAIKGDMQGARKWFLRSSELAHLRGSIQEEFLSGVALASISLHLGELQDVESRLRTLEDLLKLLPDPSSARFEWKNLQAFLYLMRGDLKRAGSIFQSGMEETLQRGDLQGRAAFIEGVVETAFTQARLEARSDWADVEAALEAALEISKRGILDRTWIYSQHSLLKIHQKKFTEARKWQKEVQRSILEKPSLFGELLTNQIEVELSMAEERWEDALKYFDWLAAQKDKLSYFSLGWSLVLWADTLMARGEPADLEQAQGYLLEAQAIFEQMGSRKFLNLVKEKIQKLREKTYAMAAAQQKVSHELAQAGLVQESFLPEQPPNLPGWQITAVLKPARSTTGDFYDFIPLPGNKFGVVIADVTDKGMGAALFMTSTRTLLRAYASEHPDQPNAVLGAVNRQITQNTHGGLYITLFYGILDPEKKSLLYCNAGHNPPCLFKGGGTITELQKTGIPLGVFESSSWEVGKVQCSSSSALILYTDGVTEAQDMKGNVFGSAGLIRAVQSVVSAPGWRVQDIQDSILSSNAAFSQGLPQLDDITLVVMACEG